MLRPKTPCSVDGLYGLLFSHHLYSLTAYSGEKKWIRDGFVCKIIGMCVCLSFVGAKIYSSYSALIVFFSHLLLHLFPFWKLVCYRAEGHLLDGHPTTFLCVFCNSGLYSVDIAEFRARTRPAATETGISMSSVKLVWFPLQPSGQFWSAGTTGERDRQRQPEGGSK